MELCWSTKYNVCHAIQYLMVCNICIGSNKCGPNYLQVVLNPDMPRDVTLPPARPSAQTADVTGSSNQAAAGAHDEWQWVGSDDQQDAQICEEDGEEFWDCRE